MKPRTEHMTKRQLMDFKCKLHSAEDLYNEMKEFFKKFDQDRYSTLVDNENMVGLKIACNILQPYYLYNMMLNNYTFIDYTIDQHNRLYINRKIADRKIHYLIHDYKLKYPEAFAISDTLDLFNTYLCHYNLYKK